MNATKVTDAVARLLGVDHARFDDAGARGAGRSGRARPRPAPRRRADTEPPGRDRHADRPAHRRDAGPTRPGRGRRAWCATCSPGPTRSGTDRRGRVFLVGGAARSAAYRRVVADLTGRAVIGVPAEDELVAGGRRSPGRRGAPRAATSPEWRRRGDWAAARRSSPTTPSTPRPSAPPTTPRRPPPWAALPDRPHRRRASPRGCGYRDPVPSRATPRPRRRSGGRKWRPTCSSTVAATAAGATSGWPASCEPRGTRSTRRR